MIKPNAVTEALRELTPQSPIAQFEREMWPAVKEALARDVTLRAIYEQLTEKGLLSISYVAFTRRIKKLQEKGTGERHEHTMPAQASAASGVDHTIQKSSDEPGESASMGEDKSDRILSAAGSALDEAREKVQNTDYARIARQAERKK
jgi:hypothetical protein